MKLLKITLWGEVQGVGFRYSAKQQADNLGIKQAQDYLTLFWKNWMYKIGKRPKVFKIKMATNQ